MRNENTEHARTAYHKICGTEYQQPYRRFNSQTPYFEVLQMEYSTSAPNERASRITELAEYLSFNHPSVVLTADVFSILNKTHEKKTLRTYVATEAQNVGTYLVPISDPSDWITISPTTLYF